MRDNQVLCQVTIKPKANVSCQLDFRLFVSCQLKFWPFVSCQLTQSRPSVTVWTKESSFWLLNPSKYNREVFFFHLLPLFLFSQNQVILRSCKLQRNARSLDTSWSRSRVTSKGRFRPDMTHSDYFWVVKKKIHFLLACCRYATE